MPASASAGAERLFPCPSASCLNTHHEDSKQRDPMADDEMKIEIVRNGPYVVYGGIPLYDGHIKANAMGKPLRWERDGRYETDGTYSLCRCGRSDAMPFCSGKHLQGFDGTETADDDPYADGCKLTEGCEGVTLMQKPILCLGAGFCHGVDHIEKTIRKRSTLDTALQQTYDCPGGSLTLRVDGEIAEPGMDKEIWVTSKGGRAEELWVRGGIPVVSADGHGYEVRNRVALCRCGKSENKPFCDGMHLQ